MFKLLKREIQNEEYGKEIVVEKKYVLDKDKWMNRLWVFQPQDPVYVKLNQRMQEEGLW